MSEEKIDKRYIIGTKKEDNKHFACLMVDDTSEVVYVSHGMETVEDAIRDARAQLVLLYAEQGKTIKMVVQKPDQQPSE